ncbi:MchS3 family protein [Herbaspirillum huttiense]|uniref:MchS3 family protein n=1 Tax=Herbaspirillum huttiense TaxID=863372 RepID=UPI0031D65978
MRRFIHRMDSKEHITACLLRHHADSLPPWPGEILMKPKRCLQLPRSLMMSGLLMLASPYIHATESAADDLTLLRQTPTFALGQVGFIGRISDSEQRYRRLLQSPAALELFTRLIDDGSATKEARLYAACALRKLNAAQFVQLTNGLRKEGGHVSVLRTDILRREPIQDQLQNIAQHGCADAHWR